MVGEAAPFAKDFERGAFLKGRDALSLEVLDELLLEPSPVLDVGNDDYYGHSGGWPDLQDSLWLRLVSQQIRLTLAIAGRGSVESDVPGIDCTASCGTDWDAGSLVSAESAARFEALGPNYSTVHIPGAPHTIHRDATEPFLRAAFAFLDTL